MFEDENKDPMPLTADEILEKGIVIKDGMKFDKFGNLLMVSKREM